MTLYHDFRRYQALYDDVEYNHGRPYLTLNPTACTDARRWFMGYAWGEHALQQPVSSSIARCLLMAMRARQEVSIPYESPQGMSYRVHRGVPIGILSGTDSAYMRLWMEDGRIMHFDLARIRGLVQWTYGSLANYHAPPDDPIRYLRVELSDERLLRYLINQFPGLIPEGPTKAVLRLPQSQCYMTANIIEAWVRRHVRQDREANRSAVLGPKTTLKIEVST
ncbi:MAG: hypothetical protein IRY98_12960 [Alicyclobacillaceae bacterium]|nr:hypothetical protein [Alicyclobacillaceae bacterium]